MIGMIHTRLAAAFGLLGGFLLSGFLLCGIASAQQGDAKDPYAVERERLIRNVLIPGGIKDPRVLDSVAKTLRHEFVPPQYVRQAYLDIAIPIGESQTISSPFIVSLMTEALQPKATDKVLEIGTGSGYQAAILSPLVKDVFTIESSKISGSEPPSSSRTSATRMSIAESATDSRAGPKRLPLTRSSSLVPPPTFPNR